MHPAFTTSELPEIHTRCMAAPIMCHVSCSSLHRCIAFFCSNKDNHAQVSHLSLALHATFSLNRALTKHRHTRALSPTHIRTSEMRLQAFSLLPWTRWAPQTRRCWVPPLRHSRFRSSGLCGTSPSPSAMQRTAPSPQGQSQTRFSSPPLETQRRLNKHCCFSYVPLGICVCVCLYVCMYV